MSQVYFVFVFVFVFPASTAHTRKQLNSLLYVEQCTGRPSQEDAGSETQRTTATVTYRTYGWRARQALCFPEMDFLSSWLVLGMAAETGEHVADHHAVAYHKPEYWDKRYSEDLEPFDWSARLCACVCVCVFLCFCVSVCLCACVCVRALALCYRRAF